MSGPKGVSVVVVAPQELERRALEAAKARHEVALERAEQVRARVRDLAARGVVVGEPPVRERPAGNSRTVQQLADNLMAECDRIERAIADARAQQLAAQVLAGLASSGRPDDGQSLVVLPDAVVTTGSALRQARARQGAAATGDGEGWRQEVVASVGRTLAEYPVRDGAEREQIERQSAAVLRESSAQRARSLLMALQGDVAAAIRREGRRRQFEHELQQLAVRVRALPTDTAGQVRAHLADLADAVEDGDGLEALRRGVEEAERAASAEADRRFAVRVAVECLSALGYQVDEGFETLVAADVAYLRHPDRPGHAVQMRARPGAPLMGFNVVRAGTPSAGDVQQDAAAEATWCTDFHHARQEARSRGVVLDVIRAEPPGSRALPAVEPERLRRRRVDRARQGQAQQGRLP